MKATCQCGATLELPECPYKTPGAIAEFLELWALKFRAFIMQHASCRQPERRDAEGKR